MRAAKTVVTRHKSIPDEILLNKFEGKDITGIKERRKMISEAAYFLAEHRGFRGGNEVQDWLEAEIEIDNQLAITVNPRLNY